MGDADKAVALATKIHQRAAEIARDVERDMILRGIIQPDMRAIMVDAVGRALITRAIELERDAALRARTPAQEPPAKEIT